MKNSINETVAILIATVLIGVAIAVRHLFVDQWPVSVIGLLIGASLGLVVARWATTPLRMKRHS